MIPLVKEENSWKITEDFKNKLRELKDKHKNKISSEFIKKLQKLFEIDKDRPIDENYKRFLGGFILGEGSLNASLKKKDLLLGVALDLEFSVTQHFFGVSHLINLLLVFNAGRFEYKSGSNATFVFKITNRQIIFEKVFPFWEKYILPYQSFSETKRFKTFQKFEKLFMSEAHRNKKDLIEKLLPLWDELRKQKGQKNESFTSLQNAIDYINDFTKT